MEVYRAKSLRRRASNGICSAIIAVNLKQETEDNFNAFIAASFDEYDQGARNALGELYDESSEFYRAFPGLREVLKDDVAKAKELYPNADSVRYLIKILNIVGNVF